MARHYRKHGIHIRAYRQGHSPFRLDTLQHACSTGQLQVCEEVGLLKVVKTYHKPGDFPFPIMVAFEALAETLRSKLLIKP